jgi:low affinity Fe/Cu permease
MGDETVATADDDTSRFAVAAKALARFSGSGWAIAATVTLVAVWAVAGLAAGFSRGWELVMTAGVPILTLLLLIVVQHTQNHDNLAMQLKLDELIRAIEGGEDAMIHVEDASADHLAQLERDFKAHVEETVDGSSSRRK